MSQSRRTFIRSSVLAVPGLVCAALPAMASVPDHRLSGDAARLDSKSGLLSLEQRRAACPFCRPGTPCQDHLV